jgi:TorA maturation chaperone TorD
LKTSESPLSLLSRLWLREPGQEEIAAARHHEAFNRLVADPAKLAPAYSDLFLLNVYPYGTVFTDSSAELNGPAAAEMAGRYEAAGFVAPELSEVGAPDHVGLCLAFLDHLAGAGGDSESFAAEIARWIPACAIAVLREPSAEPFYRALARSTIDELLRRIGYAPVTLPSAQPPGTRPGGEEEVRLFDVLRFLLAPARSGFFLSRTRLGVMALEAGLRLPFGSRFDVARALFVAAGQAGRVPELLGLLGEEISGWESAFRAVARGYPVWGPEAAEWLERLGSSRRALLQMRELLDRPLEVEYEEEETGPRASG